VLDMPARTDAVAEMKGQTRHRLLWTRRRVAPLVLAAAQAATPGAGRQEAAGALLDRVSSRSQRILRDAIAYDQGTRVSMYWGPFERKHDALFFLDEAATLAAPAGAGQGSSTTSK
jgi:hypothetical protein